MCILFSLIHFYLVVKRIQCCQNIPAQIHDHLISNDIVDNFQSAYKAGHSCKTALSRVYNDIITTIDRGNGAMLILLDLSAAFDTIDHDNLFVFLRNM